MRPHSPARITIERDGRESTSRQEFCCRICLAMSRLGAVLNRSWAPKGFAVSLVWLPSEHLHCFSVEAVAVGRYRHLVTAHLYRV